MKKVSPGFFAQGRFPRNVMIRKLGPKEGGTSKMIPHRSGSEGLVTLTEIAREFGISRRTLTEWLKDPELGFPEPMMIRGRGYVGRAELDAWKRSKTLTLTASEGAG
jgi:predicted DNA-binding transcriptional regulator AlpA